MTFRISEMSLEGLDELGCDTLVCTMFGEERPLQGLSGLVDRRMNGWLSRQVHSGIATSSAKLVLTPERASLLSLASFVWGSAVRRNLPPSDFALPRLPRYGLSSDCRRGGSLWNFLVGTVIRSAPERLWICG